MSEQVNSKKSRWGWLPSPELPGAPATVRISGPMQKTRSDYCRPGAAVETSGCHRQHPKYSRGGQAPMGGWLLYAAGACAACSQPGNCNRPTEKVGEIRSPRCGGGGLRPPSLPYQRNNTRSRNSHARGWGVRGERGRGQRKPPPPAQISHLQRFESQKRDRKTVFFKGKNEHLFL